MLHHVQLPFETASVPAARDFVRRFLTGWPGDHHVVELLTTELATNAILHAHSPIDLSMSVDPHMVRVEVADTSSDMPTRALAPALDAVSGRGLFLVASLANRWGATARARGKCVWFEVFG
jgi:anti-sigma regulatory factor (Ser/Thr protein kinase)